MRLKSRHSEVKVEFECFAKMSPGLRQLSPFYLAPPHPRSPMPCRGSSLLLIRTTMRCWWWWWWQWRWCFSLLKWLSVLATGCLLIFPLAAGSTAADGHTDQNGGICWWGRRCWNTNLPDTLCLCVLGLCLCLSLCIWFCFYRFTIFDSITNNTL